jgi:hypothetical protein
MILVLGEIDHNLLGGQLILDQKGWLTTVLEGFLNIVLGVLLIIVLGRFAGHSSWEVC